MRMIAIALVAALSLAPAVTAEERAPLTVDTPERAAELRALKRAWLARKLDESRAHARDHAVEGTAVVATSLLVPIASIGAAVGVASVAAQMQGDGAKLVSGAAIGLVLVGFGSILALPVVLAGGLVRVGEVEELEHEVDLRAAQLASFDAKRPARAR